MTSDQLKEEIQALYHYQDKDPEKAPKVERLVRLADSINDRDLQRQTRNMLVDAAVYGGYPEKCLGAYAWLLNDYDERKAAGENPGSWSLLWKYKWVIHRLIDFSYISREQLEGALEDMTRRYEADGKSIGPILQARNAFSRVMGYPERAQEYYEAYKEAPVDWMGDCPACVSSFHVQHHLGMGDFDTAMKFAEPILSGKQTCGSIPELFFYRLYIPYIERGMSEAAYKLHRRKPLQNTPDYIFANASAIFLLLAMDKPQSAINYFSKNIGIAFDSNNEWGQLHFYRAGMRLFRELQRIRKRKVIKLDLPEQVPFHRTDRTYNIVAVTEWLEAETKRLTEAFDERNGTKHLSEKLEQLMNMPLGNAENQA